MKQLFFILLMFTFVNIKALAISPDSPKPIPTANVLETNKDLVSLSMATQQNTENSRYKFFDEISEITPAQIQELNMAPRFAVKNLETPVFFKSEKILGLIENEWVSNMEDNNVVPLSRFMHQSFMEDISNQKQKLILSKIKEHIPHFNIEEEAKRPVKRLEVVRQHNTEHYYYLAPTEKIRLISFVQSTPEIKKDPTVTTISIEASWY